MNDEIIAEVGVVKEALAEEIRKSEAQSEAEGWRHITAPLSLLSDLAFQRTHFAHR